jgi:hypothetical protein
MAGLLGEHYFRQQQYQRVIALSDLILEHYPKDVLAIVRKGAAYGRLAAEYSAERMTSNARVPTWYYEHLIKNNYLWFQKAEALGWREETKEERQAYLKLIKRIKEQTIRN